MRFIRKNKFDDYINLITCNRAEIYSTKNIVFDGLKAKAVSLKDLKRIYKEASERSKDNAEGNLIKYKMLKNI